MKRSIIMLLLLAAMSPSLSGCFGNFALTRKIYAVNAAVADRSLRNVVTWAFFFVPVYGVAGVVDLFVFNTIEFWSGRNPLLAGEKSFTYSSGDQQFKVLAEKKATTVSYTIDRYRGEQYLDRLIVTSDLSGSHAVAAYCQPGRGTSYVTLGNGDRMKAVPGGVKSVSSATALTMLHDRARAELEPVGQR